MSTAFVTGGSGFVGRNLINALLQRGYRVKALARSTAAADKVRQAGAEPISCDIEDAAAMQAGMQGCEVVFHAAAKVEEWGDPADFYRINVEGTEKTLQAAQAARVKKFVHVGTEAALVGERRLINADETQPRASQPAGLYPWSKGLAEERVLAANRPDFATVVLRPRLIWGKGDTSLLPQIVAAVKDGSFAWINGGHYLTSTCHIQNVCEGLMLGAEKAPGGSIYFLTDGKPVEFRSFMTRLLATQGITPPTRSIPYPIAITTGIMVENFWRVFRLKSHPPINRVRVKLIGQEITVNDAKARRELGYQGHVTIEQGLAEMHQ